MTILITHHFQFGLTASHCFLAVQFIGWFTCVGLLFSEIVLTCRTWAIWERNRIIGIALVIFSLIAWIPQLVITGVFLNSFVFETLPPGFPGCSPVKASAIDFVDWVLLMVYEVVILTLMIIKAVRSFKLHGRSSVYKIVYQDGCMFYIYLFVLSSLNIVCILTLPSENAQILTNFERVIHSILNARILVSLRSLAPKLNAQPLGTLLIRSDLPTLSEFKAGSPRSDIEDAGME